jgi:hypothetical protein
MEEEVKAVGSTHSFIDLLADTFDYLEVLKQVIILENLSPQCYMPLKLSCKTLNNVFINNPILNQKCDLGYQEYLAQKKVDQWMSTSVVVNQTGYRRRNRSKKNSRKRSKRRSRKRSKRRSRKNSLKGR